MDAWFFERHCSDMSITCTVGGKPPSRKTRCLSECMISICSACVKICWLFRKSSLSRFFFNRSRRKKKTDVIDRYRKCFFIFIDPTILKPNIAYRIPVIILLKWTIVFHPFFPYFIVTTYLNNNKKTSFEISFSLMVSWYMYYNYGRMFLSWSGYEIFGKCSTSSVWQWSLVRGLGLGI